ncbi:uncharacterized protein [Primulina eburnea]|uniref:uncharacterized protein n=1 Tax=Primulina eburnea TaxID=1245227 RepID=UPI003C6C765C
MNCLIWNIRGLRGSESQQRLHAFVKEKQIKVLAVLEPLIDLDPRFMTRRLGFSGVISNLSGHIWVFFAADVRAECVFDHAQFLHIRVSASFLPTEIFCSFVYARCDYVQRRDLWASLLLVKPVLGPWLVGGDFNVVRDASECLGSRGGRLLPMEEFNTFILDSGLIDAGFEGSSFTWTNKTIWKRLDRVLVSVDWGDHFSSIRVEHLARTVSDHCPLLVTAPVFARGPSSFRFQRMWSERHASAFCQDEASQASPPVVESDVFGNIFDRLTEAERAVRSAEDVCEADPSDANWTSLSDRNEDLARITAMEADFWKQKAACHWLEDGERNTRLFHNMDLLTGEPSALDCPDFSGFPRLSLLWRMMVLLRFPLWRRSARPSSPFTLIALLALMAFPSAFFQHCWEIVHQDVFGAVLDFFQGSPMPQGFTATTITLIPKVEGARAWSDFRPISLCNVTNKIISKLLYSRLRDVVERLVSPNQSGFVPGRMISDNILLAQELTHSITLPSRGGNVILKLDMAKAYDRVQWHFLFDVMRHFGFSERVVALVSACISHCHFSVNINGSLSGFFGSTRGLRQGDPLSPLLFVLGAEYLSRGLDRLYLQHPALRYRSDCDILISHLAYADDVIIFASGGYSWYAAPCRFSASLRELFGAACECCQEFFDFASEVLWAPPLPDSAHHWVRRGSSAPQVPRSSPLSGWFSHLWLSWRSLSGPSTPSSGGRDPWKEVALGPGSSLWARFLFRKYCRLDAPACVPARASISPIWRRLLRIRPRAEPGIRWRVGLGDVSFWDDTWFGDVPLSSRCVVRGGRDVRVSHFLSEGSWDFDRLCAVVAPSVAEEIVLIPVLSGDPDLARWIHSSDGAFSVRSAWELIRQRAPSSDIFRPCWGSWLRPTMSFFLWRFWHQWLPVDEVLQRRGFALASRCQCCDMSETFTHIFIRSPVARSVWHFFGAVFRVRIPDTEDFSLFLSAWKRDLVWSRGGHVREFLPCIVLWFLWTARNDAKHRHLPISGETVKFQILSYLRLAHSARTVKPRHWLGVFHVARLLGISVALHRFHRTAIVRWLRPPSGCFKLNVDGSARGTSGDSSAGGVVRDDSGRVVLSFSEFIGAGSSLRAELWAVLLLRGFLFSPVLPVWCEWAQTLAHYMFGLLGIGWALALTLLVLFFGPLIFPGALFLFGPLLVHFWSLAGVYCSFSLPAVSVLLQEFYWMSWWFQGFFPDDPLHCYDTFVRFILQMLDLFCSGWIAIFILLFYRHCTVISWPYLILTDGIHTVTRFQIRVVLTDWILQGDGLEMRISSWILQSSPSYHLVFFGVLTLSAARI